MHILRNMATLSLASELATVTAQLTEVRSALTRAYKAQSYSTVDNSLTRQNIADLVAEEARLIRRIQSIEAQQAGTSGAGNVSAAFQ